MYRTFFKCLGYANALTRNIPCPHFTAEIKQVGLRWNCTRVPWLWANSLSRNYCSGSHIGFLSSTDYRRLECSRDDPFHWLILQKDGCVALGIELFHSFVLYVSTLQKTYIPPQVDEVVAECHAEVKRDFKQVNEELLTYYHWHSTLPLYSPTAMSANQWHYSRSCRCMRRCLTLMLSFWLKDRKCYAIPTFWKVH